ncbi:MAG: formate--tetrahydrofolate ligase [Sphaerochaetaceae bacterium]|nr:formate--tetrahydrofolate ligase [Sphaerochaetaceae bacterium]
MELDPKKMKDWEIAAQAEKQMKPITQIAKDFGIQEEELLPYGHFLGKIDYRKVLERLKDIPDGKYIDVTAITPTPLGEGKTTTTIGLVEGLSYVGRKVSGAIRQPSGGPTFNIKGSAAGGGLSQCIPLADFSLGLTGDIDAITNAHNLAMVALTSRMQHEFNYSDTTLEKKGLKRLDIDPRNPAVGWAIDFSAQALRDITIGQGGKMDGFLMKSSFQISVSSELMAILAVARDLKDMRERIGKMCVGYNKKGHPITTEDLDVAGAMTAIMARAINPTLVQTVEGQPVLVHAGPFANIAIGQSSIIADRVGLKLSDYHVTESGFGADIGFEKFWNLKCRFSGLKPSAAVLVTTVRALKMHGGGPKVTPGKPLDEVYTRQSLPLVQKGLENLRAHIRTVQKSNVPVVVCINHFYTDTEEELELITEAVQQMGERAAVSRHWERGGEGSVELARAVIEASEENREFRFLYTQEDSLEQKIDRIARDIYGADGVEYSSEALKKIRMIEEDPLIADMGVCMVKTHLSISHDPDRKGAPTGWTLPVRDVLVYQGAGFIVPVAGDIKLMPGTASDPAYRRIDIDTETGQITGLF